GAVVSIIMGAQILGLERKRTIGGGEFGAIGENIFDAFSRHRRIPRDGDLTAGEIGGSEKILAQNIAFGLDVASQGQNSVTGGGGVVGPVITSGETKMQK